jgi:hypothetical protein
VKPLAQPKNPTSQATVLWLDAPVPLFGGSQLMVSGVMSDAPKPVRRWWLQLGRAAAGSRHA